MAPPLRFPTVDHVEGYDITEVDSVVDKIVAALETPRPQLTAEDVRRVRFTPVRLRAGYRMGDVDAWLDQASERLARRR